MTTTMIDISELRRLLEAATPGEWDQSGLIVYDTCMDAVCSTNDAGDAALIVAMKNALPELLDRISSLENDLSDNREYNLYLLEKLEKVEAGWQPIETAPKDTPALILAGLRKSYQWVRIGGFRYAINDDEVSCWWSDQDDDECIPTHWMPLPTPPANLGGRDD